MIEPKYKEGDLVNYRTYVYNKRLTGRILRVEWSDITDCYCYDIMNDGDDSTLLVTRTEDRVVLISIDFTELLAI